MSKVTITFRNKEAMSIDFLEQSKYYAGLSENNIRISKRFFYKGMSNAYCDAAKLIRECELESEIIVNEGGKK